VDPARNGDPTSTVDFADGPLRVTARIPGGMASLPLNDDYKAFKSAFDAFTSSLEAIAPVPDRTREEMLTQAAAVRRTRMAEGDGARWLGLAAVHHVKRGGLRGAVSRSSPWTALLVSFSVTPIDPGEGVDLANTLMLLVQSVNPAGVHARVEEYQAPNGPAVRLRRDGVMDIESSQVPVGLAQVVAAFRQASALIIANVICPHKDDLDTAYEIITDIVNSMTITRVPA
jgi:hypothetical protein